MNGAIGKLGLVVVLVGGLVWGFFALLGQVRSDVASMKRQANALVMASDADQAGRIGVDLARR